MFEHLDSSKQRQAGELCNAKIRGEIDSLALINGLEALGLSGNDLSQAVNACNANRVETLPPPRIDTPVVSQAPIAVPVVSPPTVQIPPSFPPVDYPTPAPTITTIVPTTNPTLKPYSQWPDGVDYKLFLDQIEALIGTIATSIKEQIDVKLEPPTSTIGHIKNLQIGHIQKKLDDCEKKLVKAQDKVMKPIQQKMAECYGYMMPCGMCYPTQEQVLYGLQSGNYMQSVGLYPPGRLTNEQIESQRIINEQQQIQERIVSDGRSGIITNESTTENITNNYYGPQTNEQIETIVPTTTTQRPGTIRSEQTEVTQTTVTNNTTIKETEKSTVEYYPLLISESIQDVKPDPPVKPPDILPLPPGPEKIGIFRSPKWDFANVCEAIKASKLEGDTGKLLGFFKVGDQRHAPLWWKEAWGIPDDGNTESWGRIKKFAERGLWYTISGINAAGGEVFDRLKLVFGCGDLPADALLVKFVTGFINHWTNDAFEGLLKGFDYEVSQACPQEIPSQADIDDMYLANEISIDQWECYTKANNNLPQLATKNMSRKREHLSFEEGLKMYRLGKIPVETFTSIARRNGYLTTDDINNAIAVAIDVPTVSDLIRMMVRDVGDPEIVKEYGMDDQFEQKWSGELETYANAQGLTTEIAKLHWRAHWNHPSPTQAFEMLHRLRPDSKWANKLQEQLKVEAGTRGEKSAGVITTSADVQRLLEVNDLSWYWRERLGAISYNPLTRTDVLRAYMIDAIKEEDLLSAYQDAGYTAFDAATLVEFAKQQKKERNQRKLGSRDYKHLVKMFIDGYIIQAEFEEELKRRVPSEAKREAIMQDTFYELDLRRRKNDVDCIKVHYMNGTVDDLEAKAQMIRVGMPVVGADELIANWLCKRKKVKKEVTAAKLCEWRERNLITPEQHLKRLVNLGYTVTDADIIVKDCGISANEKTRRQIIAQVKAAAAQQAKLDAAQRRANKQAEVVANKEAKAERNQL